MSDLQDDVARACELAFKRGYDARAKEERKLTPKAKAYRDALREAYEALVAVDLHDDPTPAERSVVRVRVETAITKAEAVLK